MAAAEGATMSGVPEPLVLPLAEHRVFGVPIEEELEYIRCKWDCGPRAVYRGDRPCHIPKDWDWVTAGDCGRYGQEEIAFAVVSGELAAQRIVFRMRGRSTNEGETMHCLAQFTSANRGSARRAAVARL